MLAQPTTNHLFRTLPADVEGNDRLREPQREAHRSVRQHFERSDDHVIIQIPVGCGKTGVIATLPFGIANGRVLVIAPNLTIRDGVAEALDLADPKNFWKKTGALRDFSAGPFRAVLDGEDANLHDCNESHFVVTNIQQLASSADRWLPQFPPDYFDMILVDEGHHNVAPSWTRVFAKFPNAKVISLTATPFRGDGKRPAGTVIYRYPFTRAMVNGYIKNIHSRNVAPSELYFTYRGDESRHTLEEVMELREEAWFRRGVALSRECNEHIADASIKYLHELRDRTGYRHQLIAAACSIDHAREVRSIYNERGLRASEIHSEMSKDEREKILADLRSGKLDCIVQIQVLGEGFDHPPLSVAAIFRPFRSLSPYIQFIGRVMRVVHQDRPDHPDNHAYLVSHVGLNNDAQWDDFRELDLDDQRLFRDWMNEPETEPLQGTEPVARRFDGGMLVDNEIIGEFLRSSFLDPDDDRVLDEILAREIVGGLRLADVTDRETLRAKLRQHQTDQVKAGTPLPVQPQEQRREARKRLNERSKSVANRVLQDLGLAPVGRQISNAVADVNGTNLAAAISLMSRCVNEFLEIPKASRRELSFEEANRAFEALDEIGDRMREQIQTAVTIG